MTDMLNTAKQTLLLIAAITLSTSTFAAVKAIAKPTANPDEKSTALLAELQKKVASWGDYRVEFSVGIADQTIAGSYEVSGNSYHLATPDIELYCDGTTKWEVNRLDREVAIDRVNPADRTVMGNPTRLFDFMDGSYTHRYLGAALIDGANCDRIELKEIAAGSSSISSSAANSTGNSQSAGQTIDVFISTTTGLPVRVGYTMGMLSTEAAVDVVRITPNITLDGAFRYDPKRYAGYEIIDFR